jgi:hypothetical protein
LGNELRNLDMQKVKLLVLRARHDPSVAVIPEVACQQAIMVGTSPRPG